MQEISIANAALEISKALNCKISLKPGALTEGSTLRRCPNTKKLEALGFKARVSIGEGFKKITDWYVENAHLKP
jgi:nucleoside-diphosphate-sugar epimerase